MRLSGGGDEPATSPGGVLQRKPEQSGSTGDRDLVPGGRGGFIETSADDPRTGTRTKGGAGSGEDRVTQIPGTDEPSETKDSEPPQPVADIEPSTVTSQQLTISWPTASDNIGVIGYRVWLNGFEVATTAETRAHLRWFNDDSGQHVVQIRAIDAAGNQSRSSPTLVVMRPSPEPAPTPTPEPPDSPTPTVEPTHPVPEPSESPSDRHKSVKDR
jgi:hypothetical protein